MHNAVDMCIYTDVIIFSRQFGKQRAASKQRHDGFSTETSSVHFFGAMQEGIDVQADIAHKAVIVKLFDSPAAENRKMCSSPAQQTCCCSDWRSLAFSFWVVSSDAADQGSGFGYPCIQTGPVRGLWVSLEA